MTLFKRALSFLRNGIKMGGQRERERERSKGKRRRKKDRDEKPRGEISGIEMST